VTGKLAPRIQERLVQLGEELRRARRARGISRAVLSESIGMHPQNYARIERGKKNVTFETLLRIADGLGVELTVAFLGAPPAKNKPVKK
jgi:transcriptional regulator with XRE-family HTH domain